MCAAFNALHSELISLQVIFHNELSCATINVLIVCVKRGKAANMPSEAELTITWGSISRATGDEVHLMRHVENKIQSKFINSIQQTRW